MTIADIARFLAALIIFCGVGLNVFLLAKNIEPPRTMSARAKAAVAIAGLVFWTFLLGWGGFWS